MAYKKHNAFHDSTGSVRYFDGALLSRPLDMPKDQRPMVAVFLVVAAIIATFSAFFIFDEVANGATRRALTVEENINRDVTLNLPILTHHVLQDNDTILNSFNEAGYTMYDIAGESEITRGFDVIKLPSDVSLLDAGILYSQGVANLSAADASRLLNGSWQMTVGRTEYIDMKVKYVDFTSQGPQDAVLTAMGSEQLENTDLRDSGVDEAGNNFQSGSVEIDGTVFQWHISTCPLSEIYKINGLPSTASYVVVRMYQ